MQKRLYFGHPINVYDTALEAMLLQAISVSFPDWEIENPNQKCHQDGYQEWKERNGNGMKYYTEVVLPRCQGGIFLPFRDGAWGAGVFAEAKFFSDLWRPTWKIFANGHILRFDPAVHPPLTVEETRGRIRAPSGEMIPY